MRIPNSGGADTCWDSDRRSMISPITSVLEIGSGFPFKASTSHLDEGEAGRDRLRSSCGLLWANHGVSAPLSAYCEDPAGLSASIVLAMVEATRVDGGAEV
ncbi:hypothetical protein VTO73DRAFT_22 [Trametes versicolor]